MIIIYGKNGSGKTYTGNQLIKMGLVKSVSYTTRMPRKIEINGIDYYFIDINTFEDMIKKNLFVEYKEHDNNYYGTTIESAKNSDFMIGSDNINSDIMKYITDQYYIDCPIDIRYQRMIERDKNIIDTFKRIHGENFKYFFDEKIKIFFNNDEDISTSIYNELIGKTCHELIYIKDYINEEIKSYQNNSFDDYILKYLRYEEYLLKNLFLANEPNREKIYLNCMIDFLNKNNYQYIINDNSIILCISDTIFEAKYSNQKMLYLKK